MKPIDNALVCLQCSCEVSLVVRGGPEDITKNKQLWNVFSGISVAQKPVKIACGVPISSRIYPGSCDRAGPFRPLLITREFAEYIVRRDVSLVRYSSLVITERLPSDLFTMLVATAQRINRKYNLSIYVLVNIFERLIVDSS